MAQRADRSVYLQEKMQIGEWRIEVSDGGTGSRKQVSEAFVATWNTSQ